MQANDLEVDKLLVQTIPKDLRDIVGSIDTIIHNMTLNFNQNKFLVGAQSFVELPQEAVVDDLFLQQNNQTNVTLTPEEVKD